MFCSPDEFAVIFCSTEFVTVPLPERDPLLLDTVSELATGAGGYPENSLQVNLGGFLNSTYLDYLGLSYPFYLVAARWNARGVDVEAVLPGCFSINSRLGGDLQIYASASIHSFAEYL